ncbi:MAG TPA: translation elongation factor 4 [Thermodesulfobacteriota bacterium]|nr:translation elongation factor 4 [Thermodesulfobacteriota bacterium]
MDPKFIRNFCIIAHVDHGKSTLADRILEYTGTVEKRDMEEQFLDKMDLEKERGITIKAQSVKINYKSEDGQLYEFNLIDTPGHVDFSYEVSRSLEACEGALLVVDASQGVEAQTVANAYLAVDIGLELIPVINKIDLPSADPERVKREIEDIVGIDATDATLASAKTGIGIKEILESIIHLIPPPQDNRGKPLKALIFDSWFDSYQGVVMLVRVFEGAINVGENIMFMSTGKSFDVKTLGVFSPTAIALKTLGTGEVGLVTASIKDIEEAKVGDTITSLENPTDKPIPGFREVQPMVFSGLYPIDTNDYEKLKDALLKLGLNDASLTYEPETSVALGFGFRCGFLGLLHMEIIKERLEREFDLNLITTAPTVVYRVIDKTGKMTEVENPSKLPTPDKFEIIEEPYVKVTLHTPNQFLGAIFDLCRSKRGIQKNLSYKTEDRVLVEYELPLSEIVYDFYDTLKSISKGYASMDYEPIGYRASDLIKMEILINGDPVDALSVITHKEKAYERGKALIEKLRSLIPRQLYDVAIQAAIGNRIISRESVKALRKDVTAKCYGGDVSRKRKLLEKQKEGKKRMKQVGSIEIPQEAFYAVLKND